MQKQKKRGQDSLILPADKTSADSEAGAWDNRRQRVKKKGSGLFDSSADKAYAGADADHAVDTATASETAALKINQAEATRATALAGEENALTTGTLGFVTQFASEVADGIHTLYTSYHTGDADQAAVSTAWTTFTTQAAAAWAEKKGSGLFDSSADRAYAAGTDADHAVDAATAAETAALKINQTEATRATTLAGAPKKRPDPFCFPIK